MKRMGLWIGVFLAVIVVVFLVLSFSGPTTVGGVTQNSDELRVSILADGSCPRYSDEACRPNERPANIKSIGEECTTQNSYPGRCELTDDAPFICVCKRI